MDFSSLQLLLHGEEQLPRYPGLTRGLVAVILYYGGRKAVVQTLRTLLQSRLPPFVNLPVRYTNPVKCI